MQVAVFGLTVSSSWGNGHATIWRALCKALARRKHRVIFFERDCPYYAVHRDLKELAGGKLMLYSNWLEVLPIAKATVCESDVAMVTSYCPDAQQASELILVSDKSLRAFYDLDAPVTLAAVTGGKIAPYIPAGGLGKFDIVFSYAGGPALEALKANLGAVRVDTLYGTVDPELHHRVPDDGRYTNALSFLGTYAPDRHQRLLDLFKEPAQRRAGSRFLLSGSMYPESFTLSPNVIRFPHLSPSEHSAFYSSSRLTLNISRQAMMSYGFCPSGRLFEAAACRTPIVSDAWDGLESFFTPSEEILIARSSDDVLNAMDQDDASLERIARAAHERVIAEHTADARVRQFESAMESLASA